MKKALLIAEKPSICRIIKDVYDRHRNEVPYDITFVEQRGHLLTLKLPDELDESLKEWKWDTLPFHPENYGGWRYKVISEKKTGNFLTSKERYEKIKKELATGNYDVVINAGDADQEGELLVRIVLASLKNKLPVLRFWANATTEKEVLEALQNLKDDDNDPMLVNLLKAAYCRQHSDYRFGMNASRAATLKLRDVIGKQVALGRVKSTIQAIVCKREIEIKNFVPKTCYGVKALYSEGFEGQLFGKSTDENDDGYIWFDKEEDAKQLANSLGSRVKVVEFETKRVESYAPKLFKLATAQMAAGKYGLSPDETLSVIQGLYEKGYITYPRTDCEYLSSKEDFKTMLESAAATPSLKPYIAEINGAVISKVKSTKKWVNDAELEKSGHSALAPTTKKPDWNDLSDKEKTVYELICRQFVAIFLPPLIQDKTVLVGEVDNNLFKSTGKTLIDAGFSVIFGTKFVDMEIPRHNKGDILSVDNYDITTKTSTCPKRFTEADLIAVCESPAKYLDDDVYKKLGKELKIGTPATRASIIVELIDKNQYLQRTKEGKTIYVVPTEAGMMIYSYIKNCIICKVDMTGEWEEKLSLLRYGKMEYRELEDYMISEVNGVVEELKNLAVDTSKKLASSDRAVVTKCTCGGDIISGPKGFYCSNYKEGCKMGAYKKICDSTVTDKEFAKMFNGEKIIKKIKKGKDSWDQELAYDPENHSFIFCKNEQKEPEVSGYTCPKCGETLVESDKVIKCNGCDFKFYKVPFGWNKPLPKTQIDAFFNSGDTGLVKGLKGKSGKSFDAHIVLNEEQTGTKYKFEERE